MPLLYVTDRAGKTHSIEGQPGITLMQILRINILDIEAVCDGNCSCATCHILVGHRWSAKLMPPSSDEQELVEGSSHYKAGSSRLACQITFTEALNEIAVVVAPAE